MILQYDIIPLCLFNICLTGDFVENNMQEKFLRLKRELFEILYGHLNPMQRKAVFTVNDPLLILAGAGSGKTTVLVNRISYIIEYGNSYFSEYVPSDIDKEDIKRLEDAKTASKEEISTLLKEYAVDPCPPWALLAITFTNKAAREISDRLRNSIFDKADDVWTGTFHSVCLRILRKHGDRIGLEKNNITIYDTDDTKKLIGSCMKELNIDEKIINSKSVRQEISRCKDKLITPSMLEEDAVSNGEIKNFRLSKIAAIYRLYQQKMSEANALDFDDIIVKTVDLLNTDEEIRHYYQKKFKYVCIDEYQDTNHAQFVLTSILAGGYNNIMAVGDDDQSIYKFRGATIENILNFDKTFKNVNVIKLEQNYRSTSYILDAANSIIKNNIGRKGKELWTDKKGGSPILIKQCSDQTDEAKYIVNKIEEFVVNEKRKYSDFAVLCRMNVQSGSIENVLVKSGIPFRMLCGQRFYERKEVKDILSYLCLINNPNDDLRLKRIINEPKRQIGDTTVSAVEKIAAAEECSMFDVMKNSEKYVALSHSKVKLHDFVSMIEYLKDISHTVELDELVQKTIIMSGYEKMLLEAGESEKERLDNVLQMISNAQEYMTNNPEGNLTSYLEEVSLVADVDNYDTEADAVTIMTIHSAKGLEFPIVFIPGCEEGIFPGIRSAEFDEELEEERRLAYVAITRAKEKLVCTHARERMLFGQTQYNDVSRFIKEIPDKYTETEKMSFAKNNFENRYAKSDFGSFELSKEFSKSVQDNQKPRQNIVFEIGNRVKHITFGEGTVLSAKTMGADILYEVAFDNVGTKKLMGTYAKLKKL